MKHFTSILPLALVLMSGAALAAEPQSTTQPAPAATTGHSHAAHSHADHAQMKHEHAAKTDEFAGLDANKDGTLSKVELSKHRLGPHFGMLDANRDGKLTQAEFAAGHGM